MAIISWLSVAAASFAGSALALTGQMALEFGYPSGVDVWCGKAYRATYVHFDATYCLHF